MAVPTRERILERARSVLEKEDKPTVAQFAMAAGVSRASFYRVFRSREALLDALEVAPEPGTKERILDAALVEAPPAPDAVKGLSFESLA